MRNHPLYKKLEQYAIDNNLTIEQVENAEYNQVAKILGTHSFSLAFLANMKRGIIMSLQNRDDEQAMQDLKQQAKNWLDTNFPNWQAERGREGDKPYITVWLKGKP